MPSSPKIPKETILEHALNTLIRDGYNALNIKALAKEIGCSTQPISWHFGSMDGLRAELGKYALLYANRKLHPTSVGVQAFIDVGTAYVGIAFDEPKLFQYLYMSADSGYFGDGFDALMTRRDNVDLVEPIAMSLHITEKKALLFCKNMIIYTHGLASYVASGLVKATKDEVIQMMHQASEGFLIRAGVPLDKIPLHYEGQL
ncbi:MAG: TetR/AcrR family transcriptional regulator [Clostridiales bacterium]|nr:TetR/AcrR family transcriptional regulator [Clostridiales bacterium]MDU3242912.1 TetR/AcrR family transcriptional regulator [Clostridiales bacterium]